MFRHHDITNKNASLSGAHAIIVKAPVYPNTWLSVKLTADPSKIIKVRTSQLAGATKAAHDKKWDKLLKTKAIGKPTRAVPL